MRAYAAASSTTTNYSTIMSAATVGESGKPSKPTTQKYRDKLSEIWMLDPLPAWNHARAPFARIAQSPKLQLADPALAVTLLDIPSGGLLQPRFAQHTGPLFESLATLSVRVAAEANFGTVGHFRTRSGDHEVDLVVTTAEGAIIAFEVKLSASVKDSDVAQLRWFREHMPDDVADTVVLYTGQHAYRRKDGIAVIPLNLLGL